MLELNPRSTRRFLVGLFAFLSLSSGNVTGGQDLPREHLPTSWKQDAELTDVFFLDTLRGWAVGAQGTIVRTTDGGKNWTEISQVPDVSAGSMSLDQKFQNMRRGVQSRSTGMANGSSSHQPMTCRFESVHFVDEQLGWVAGGYDVPYVGRSRAVVMRTRDGGLTWNAVKNLVIPRLRKIQFSDRMNGWAIGETGNLFPSGIFHTSDGGFSWSSKSSEKTAAWIDAEPTGWGFITINEAGRLGAFRSNKYEPAVIVQDNPNSIARLKMIDQQQGWAVGANGTVLQTTNQGLSWTPVKIPELSKLAAGFDFHALGVFGQRLWLAGDPGTVLFSIDLTHGNVETCRTPANVRINQIQFTDPLHGWAVGARGSIIATVDGGKTWSVQRGGGQRTAILCVSGDEPSLPFEVLSKYSTEENQICSSLILSTSKRPTPAAVQATERLGSTTLFNIDVSPQPGRTDADNRQQSLEKIVRTIRTLQPNVIVFNTENMGPGTRRVSSVDPLILIQEAIRAAAARNSFSHQLELADLKVWQVDRLAVRDPSGSVTIDPQRLLPRNGVLIEDQISLSRALTGQSVLIDAPSRYRITHCTNRDRMQAGDLLSGLDPRKRVPPRDEDVKRGNLGMIQQANAKHKKFEQFVRFEAQGPQDLLVWKQQVQSFAIKMDQAVAGVWLMQLAERYLEAGKTELAANTATLLVTHWSSHAFAPASLTWLAHYYASDEFAQIELNHRASRGQLDRGGQLSQAAKLRNDFVTTPKSVQAAGSSHLVWVPTEAMINAELKDGDGDSTGLQQASSIEPIASTARPAFFHERLKLASRFLTQLSQQDPDLASGAQHQLLETHLSRRINGIFATEGRYKSLVQRRDFEGIGISLGAQRELAIGGRLPPSADQVPMLICLPTDQRPKLDGRLDESFWQTAISSGNIATPRTQGIGGQPNSKSDLVMFAYDDEFLYAGFHCHKIEGQYYNAASTSHAQARTRDAELNRRDRVELVLDIDRDYRSANRFVIDHRGWVRESCGGSLGWNPSWYVSQTEDDATWTVEIAIPLKEIVPAGIEPESTWAFQVARRGFTPHNLWNENRESAEEIDRWQRKGIRKGLESRPADFELLRFHANQAEASAHVETEIDENQ